jgi:hypothetical protein
MTVPRSVRTGAAALVAATLLLTGCTDAEPEPTASPSPSQTVTSAPRPKPLTPKERLQQLTALAPDVFNAAYQLTGRGPRPDADVSMRMAGEWFRLDVTQGRTTAVLVYGPRGVASCQVEGKKDGRPTRTCFLVADTPKQLPPLFDPGVQRLFRGTTEALAQGSKQIDVRRAGTWKAPGKLGEAECFTVKGPGVERGTYCYLAEPGPYIGLLARAVFPSGTLELRAVNRMLREGVFRPPVRPTPLPTGG